MFGFNEIEILKTSSEALPIHFSIKKQPDQPSFIPTGKRCRLFHRKETKITNFSLYPNHSPIKADPQLHFSVT